VFLYKTLFNKQIDTILEISGIFQT